MGRRAKEKPKEQRIEAERKRLEKVYAKMTDDRKAVAAGLIERAAFMRIECEDLETFLKENGWTDVFVQKGSDPYDRARPQGQSYQSLNKNYQAIIKLLDSLLPPQTATAEAGDEFGAFVAEREEM